MYIDLGSFNIYEKQALHMLTLFLELKAASKWINSWLYVIFQ